MSGPEHLDPHEIARLREAFASLADQPDQPRWPPADAERLFAALHGDVPAEERRAIVDELVRYPDAAAVWRLARELAPEPSPSDARAPKTAVADCRKRCCARADRSDRGAGRGWRWRRCC
jgi:hypothetical protein